MLLPDNWYEQDIEPVYECHDCNLEQKKLEKAADWLESILDRIYAPNADIFALENDLDELSYLLDVKMRKGDIQIQSKQITEFKLPIPKFIQLNK